jgi:hypothetical protein
VLSPGGSAPVASTVYFVDESAFFALRSDLPESRMSTSKYKLRGLIIVAFAASVSGLALSATPTAAVAQELAFMHEPSHDWYGHGHHQRGGCFVTTSPTNHTRGIRHWRYPCPHHHRKHLNPYHPPHHRMHPHH